LCIKPKIVITDHHETVGQVEKCNSFVEQYLKCYSRTFSIIIGWLDIYL